MRFVLTVYLLCSRFSLMDKGSKCLYLNTSVRGYPLGLRAGRDPRNPIVSVDGGFEKVNILLVWGILVVQGVPK